MSLWSLKVAVVDTADFVAIHSVSSSVIFINETIHWVECSLEFFFFERSPWSCCLCSFRHSFWWRKSGCVSLFSRVIGIWLSLSCCKFSLLFFFFLQRVIILSSIVSLNSRMMFVMMTIMMIFHPEESIDTFYFDFVTNVEWSTIIFVNLSIKLVVFSFEFSLLKSFLCCCSICSFDCLSLLFVSYNLSLVSFQDIILFFWFFQAVVIFPSHKVMHVRVIIIHIMRLLLESTHSIDSSDAFSSWPE